MRAAVFFAWHSCAASALLAVRQVLPQLTVLPEDTNVVDVEGELYFNSNDSFEPVPDGVAVLKIEPTSAEHSRLFVTSRNHQQQLIPGNPALPKPQS